MLNGFTIECSQAFVLLRFVRVHDRAFGYMLTYKAKQSLKCCVLCMSLTCILPESRSLIPINAVLPTVPPPTLRLLLSCLFSSWPPKYASSSSTGLYGGPPVCGHASRKCCAIKYADFCVNLNSRCSFMADTPLSEVAHKKTIPHFW